MTIDIKIMKKQKEEENVSFHMVNHVFHSCVVILCPYFLNEALSALKEEHFYTLILHLLLKLEVKHNKKHIKL